MTAQQRDMVDQILRNAPFDLGGDVAAQRPILEQMLTAVYLTRPGDSAHYRDVLNRLAAQASDIGETTASLERFLHATA